MMKQIYMDNGSTSYPKAPGLGEVMAKHIESNGVNISRGGYGKAYELEEAIIETRRLLCDMFEYEKVRNVVFTSGATMSLNMIIGGSLRRGDHIITSSMEHNAVVRPIYEKVCHEGVEWTEIPCDEHGLLDMDALTKAFRPNTRLVLMLHASNVCGVRLPIREIGAVCEEKNVFFAVDASQTAGSDPISMKKDKIQALAFPGHKSLLGPQGVGGMLLSDEMADMMKPVLYGGTGSFSDEEAMPNLLPDKFQPGTLNLPGIVGLRHSLQFIQQEGISTIKKHKEDLAKRFIDGVREIPGIRIAGEGSLDQGYPSVISLDFAQKDNGEMSYLLESEYGILTRCGLHCAPHAHKTLKTFPKGTVRFSPGYFNTGQEIDDTIMAVKKVSRL